MALKFGKRERQRVADVLEAEHESLENAVEAVLELVDELVADRASFVVVGQLVATRERLSVPPSDPEAVKLCLGLYSTEGDARSAAESLWFNTASGDTFATWALPVEHKSPSEFHKDRKQYWVGVEAKREAVVAERVRKSIEKFKAEAQARADAARQENAA